MKPSTFAASLLLLLSAAPLCAHGVFVPLPRNPNPDTLEYRVKILATNQGLQTRRFQVSQVIPQPFGPPHQEKLADRGVLARTVGVFELKDTEEFSGLLRVGGAPQMVVSALLEIRENGKLLQTVSLPAVSSAEDEDHQRADVKHDDDPDPNGDLDHGTQLLGLAASADGSVLTDFTLVNLSEDEVARCSVGFFSPAGPSLGQIPFVQSPVGAATVVDDVFTDQVTTAIENVRAQAACEEDTFFAWAAVYRDGGRNVTFVTPAVSTK